MADMLPRRHFRQQQLSIDSNGQMWKYIPPNLVEYDGDPPRLRPPVQPPQTSSEAQPAEQRAPEPERERERPPVREPEREPEPPPRRREPEPEPEPRHHRRRR